MGLTVNPLPIGSLRMGEVGDFKCGKGLAYSFFRNECNTGHFFPWKLFAVKPDNQTIVRAGFDRPTCIYRTAL